MLKQCWDALGVPHTRTPRRLLVVERKEQHSEGAHACASVTTTHNLAGKKI